MTATILNQPWEDVADDVTSAIEKAVQPLLKKAVDDIYGGLLDATQDYLRDNVAFNIASRIATAEREACDARTRCAALQTEKAALLEALEDARTSLSITRTNIMCEIGRCADPSESRWEGVPEQLAKRLAKIDAAISLARGGE